MLTIEQIRAARALIGWSQGELADHAGLSQTGIARIENGTNKPNSSTLAKITTAFDKVDVEFIGETGVKKRTSEVRTLNGPEGFKEFMNDVYKTAQDVGGVICLHNARPDNWRKWLDDEWWKMHSDRMEKLGNRIEMRITAEEGNTNLISSAFAEYRWLPRDVFNDQSVYAYGNKLAFVTFGQENVSVNILDNAQFCEGFRVLFNNAWDHIAMRIPNK